MQDGQHQHLPEKETGDKSPNVLRGDILHLSLAQLRYYKKREWFFDKVDKITRAITVVLGAALFGPLVSYFKVVGAVVAFAGLLSIIFDYGGQKRFYQQLAEQTAQLVADIYTNMEPNKKDTGQWQARLAKLDGQAPPPLVTLMTLCEIEQYKADGREAPKVDIGRWKKLFRHFF